MVTHDDLTEINKMLETLDRTEDQLNDLIERMRRKTDSKRVHELRTAAMQLANVRHYIENARQ